MKKSTANTFLILICCLFVSSCDSTNSSNLTLEDIIPNSTWYYINDTDVYAKVVFNNLNTTADLVSYIPFPCDTDSGNFYQTAKYDIINDSKIYFTADQLSETVIEVIDYSKTRITGTTSADNMAGSTFITFRSRCADLR